MYCHSPHDSPFPVGLIQSNPLVEIESIYSLQALLYFMSAPFESLSIGLHIDYVHVRANIIVSHLTNQAPAHQDLGSVLAVQGEEGCLGHRMDDGVGELEGLPVGHHGFRIYSKDLVHVGLLVVRPIRIGCSTYHINESFSDGDSVTGFLGNW